MLRDGLADRGLGESGNDVNLVDKLIGQFNVVMIARRAAVFAYTGWVLAIVCGCLGWWSASFTAMVVLIALLCHLAGGRAQHLLGQGNSQP